MSERRCAVVGDPVAHSLSPALHTAAYRALGLAGAWRYTAMPVPEGGLAAAVAGLDDAWRGLSVTAPLKREALALAAAGGRVGATALAAGAVNTLVLDPVSGAVRGENTDVPGAVEALRERGVDGLTHVTVLGGGATATSLGLSARQLGAERIDLWVRRPERAVETRDALEAAGARVRVVRLDDGVGQRADIGEAVLSTVPAAAQTEALVERAAAAGAVFDAVYDPWPTPLARAALDAGARVVNGLDLLAHQAVLQVALFVEAAVDVGVLRRAGVDELRARADA